MEHRKGICRKILTIVCDAILCFCIVLTCYIMISGTKGRVANVFGKSILRVVTGSMEPSIYAGEYILVEKVPCDQLSEGDIITFYSEDEAIYGMPNTHRIIAVNEDGSFITKGDANSTADKTAVTPDRVIGKYTGKLRFIRWLGSFASVKKLVLLGVIIVMLCISVYELRSVLKIIRMSEDEKTRLRDEEREKLIREAVEKEKQRLYEEHYNEQGQDGEED